MKPDRWLTRRLVRCLFMLLVIATRRPVGGPRGLEEIEVSADDRPPAPFATAEANSDRVGTVPAGASSSSTTSVGCSDSIPAPSVFGFVTLTTILPAGGSGERRAAAATASSSLRLRLSFTRSDKLLTGGKTNNKSGTGSDIGLHIYLVLRQLTGLLLHHDRWNGRLRRQRCRHLQRGCHNIRQSTGVSPPEPLQLPGPSAGFSLQVNKDYNHRFINVHTTWIRIRWLLQC